MQLITNWRYPTSNGLNYDSNKGIRNCNCGGDSDNSIGIFAKSIWQYFSEMVCWSLTVVIWVSDGSSHRFGGVVVLCNFSSFSHLREPLGNTLRETFLSNASETTKCGKSRDDCHEYRLLLATKTVIQARGERLRNSVFNWSAKVASDATICTALGYYETDFAYFKEWWILNQLLIIWL